MSQDRNTVRVNIYGTEYPITAELDPAYIQKLAKYVDDRMNQIPIDATTQSMVRVAILAAFHIADELYREREDKEKAIKALDEQVATLMHRLDEALQTT